MVNLEARGSIPRGEIFCCSESSGILLFFWSFYLIFTSCSRILLFLTFSLEFPGLRAEVGSHQLKAATILHRGKQFYIGSSQ